MNDRPTYYGFLGEPVYVKRATPAQEPVNAKRPPGEWAPSPAEAELHQRFLGVTARAGSLPDPVEDEERIFDAVFGEPTAAELADQLDQDADDLERERATFEGALVQVEQAIDLCAGLLGSVSPGWGAKWPDVLRNLGAPEWLRARVIAKAAEEDCS